MWFGANVSGPDAPHLKANSVLRYQSVWFGWQTMNGVGGCQHEENKLSTQAAAVKWQGGAQKTTLVYGCDVSNVMDFYDVQRSALANASNYGWFLHAPKLSREQHHERDAKGTCGFSASPAWDFRNESARKYFAEIVIGQWAEDPAVDAVFVDEADALVCYWSQGSSAQKLLPTLDDVYAWSNGSVLAYKSAAKIMAAKGKRLVVSLKNGFEGASPVNQKVGHPCAVPLDKIAQSMGETPWIRFHEYFAALPPLSSGPLRPGRDPPINGSTMCHNMIETAMRQAAFPNMAFAVHGGTYNSQSSLNLTFAMFMLARNGMPGTPIDFFSWSTGDYWMTHDWSWKNTSALYEHKWGLPRGTAQRNGSVWTRVYSGATISLDCSTLNVKLSGI